MKVDCYALFSGIFHLLIPKMCQLLLLIFSSVRTNITKKYNIITLLFQGGLSRGASMLDVLLSNNTNITTDFSTETLLIMTRSFH